MTHIAIVFTHYHHSFARQLATHLSQRGLVVWPVGPVQQVTLPPADQGVSEASHVLLIVPPDHDPPDDTLPDNMLPDGEVLQRWENALATKKRVAVLRCAECTVPEVFRRYPEIDFGAQFLVAVEELVRWLEKTGAPTHPLTVEHPPPISKAGLLPGTIPSERCWREDRLRINYNLPIILNPEDLEVRLPAFLVKAGFELERSTHKQIKARRLHKRYHLFDPRRAQHTFTIRRRKGHVSAYYRMTRTQVYHWFPDHYRVLDREAAGLYRYLVTGKLDDIFRPVQQQARRAQVSSWSAIVAVVVFLSLLVYVLVW